MTESTSDVPGAEGGETVCPVCDAATTEQTGGGGLGYRCLDCGAAFDPSGGRVNIE